MFSSFRFKIVLLYSAIVLTTLLAFRVGSEHLIRQSLYEELDNSLRGEIEWMRAVLEAYRTKNLPDEEIRHEIDARSILSPRKEFIEIYDVKGAEYFRSTDLELDQLRPHGEHAFAKPVTVPQFRQRPLRLLAAQDSLYEIYVGYPLTDLDAAIEKIASSFVVLIPLTLLFLAAGGLLLVAHFVRPITELNQYASALVQQPLDRELPQMPVRTKDEIGALIMRINEVVEKMRASMRQTLSFSSLASHELRTPLAIVRHQLENALRARVPVSSLRKTLASTYDEILRLNRIVDDLLSLGTMQAGTFKFERRRLAFDTLLKEFHEEARLLASEKGITVELQEAAPVFICADVLRLRQVLFNLLDNAIKHTPAQGTIQLSYRVVGCEVIFQFTDSGTGIPPQQLQKIFDPFYRVHTNGASMHGTGLGLALVRWIVEAHQGTVSAQSAPQLGTTFIITLPQDEGARAAPQE